MKMRSGARLLAVLCGVGCLVLAACGDESGGGGDDENNSANNSANNSPGNNNPANNNPNSANNSTPAVETDFAITYVARNRSEVPGIEPGGELMLLSSDDTEQVRISPEGVPCQLGCRVSEDLSWFVWIDQAGEDTELRVAPITAFDYDGVVVDTASAETVETNPLGFSVQGGTLAWSTQDFEVKAAALPGSGAESLGVVGAADGTQGGFYLAPSGDQVVTWTVTLSTMTLMMNDLSGGEAAEIYTLESNGAGGTGSFYGPREKMAMSPDGRYLAVASRGLVDSDPCTSNDECVAPAACGATGRCTEQRLTINMLDLSMADKLGGACSSDGECGDAHLCDFGNAEDPSAGVCIPGRLDLGAAGPQKCNAHQPGEFTDLRDTIQWSPDSRSLYFLAVEDCSKFNVPRAAILRTDAGLSTPTAVVENPGADFDPGKCYDFDEEEYTVGSPECVLDIAEMSVAPTGATIIFAASSPSSTTGKNFELYSVDAAGRRGKSRFLSTEDATTEVEQLHAVGEP